MLDAAVSLHPLLNSEPERKSMTDLILRLETVNNEQTAKAEPFAGTHIARACEQATNVATLLGVVVHFDFNGVACYARPGSDWRTLQEAWEKICETPEEKRTRFAMAWSAARTIPE
jgi:hypothetical protein